MVTATSTRPSGTHHSSVCAPSRKNFAARSWTPPQPILNGDGWRDSRSWRNLRPISAAASSACLLFRRLKGRLAVGNLSRRDPSLPPCGWTRHDANALKWPLDGCGDTARYRELLGPLHFDLCLGRQLGGVRAEKAGREIIDRHPVRFEGGIVIVGVQHDAKSGTRPYHSGIRRAGNQGTSREDQKGERSHRGHAPMRRTRLRNGCVERRLRPAW